MRCRTSWPNVPGTADQNIWCVGRATVPMRIRGSLPTTSRMPPPSLGPFRKDRLGELDDWSLGQRAPGLYYVGQRALREYVMLYCFGWLYGFCAVCVQVWLSWHPVRCCRWAPGVGITPCGAPWDVASPHPSLKSVPATSVHTLGTCQFMHVLVYGLGDLVWVYFCTLGCGRAPFFSRALGHRGSSAKIFAFFILPQFIFCVCFAWDVKTREGSSVSVITIIQCYVYVCCCFAFSLRVGVAFELLFYYVVTLVLRTLRRLRTLRTLRTLRWYVPLVGCSGTLSVTQSGTLSSFLGFTYEVDLILWFLIVPY